MTRRRREGVTIRAVAERAGVSAMTVSNVINRTGRASPATAAAVHAAVAELGYVPNVVARRLARARATTVGLLYSGRRAPFLDAILVGALRATNARGLQLLLHQEEPSSRAAAEHAAQSLARGGADALLLVPPFAELLSGSDMLATLRLPVAAIATGHVLPDIATVRIDNRAAMAELTALLIARGHRRIALIAGNPGHSDSAERVEGYRDALAAHGIAADPALLIAGRYDQPSGEAAAQLLLARNPLPDAIMCSNDDMAAGVIAAAHRRGVRLPHDLAVTGFDDTTLAARIWPSLTTVRQPAEDMAFRAAERLIGTGDGDTSATDLIVAHAIIERESTAPRM
ncbi:LacI family transcriptional regulator [Sphingomonas sp. Leaf231]|uniref:LacI family DNA-binding transcriptional regulator n=1 Tax=Sphingomonas sp. Leaf231 TaxID=1736301 RepID=UPI0006FB2304|nr:LacI family DNA-binding transcriptional regulator [Sphingomonas sp. Leaf231]KQN93253.1 LacI family transcriptional regulator [Sphingomonas sp. Leaf231]